MVTAREFVGGPFHGEMRAVDESSMTISMPIAREHRANPSVPEWVAYRLDSSGDMVFAGRGPDPLDVLFEAKEKK